MTEKNQKNKDKSKKTEGVKKSKNVKKTKDAEKTKSTQNTATGRVLMMTQELSYLPSDSDFTKICKNSKATDWAWIIHDKDRYTQEDIDSEKKNQSVKVGDLKPEHVHVLLRFKNPVRVSKVATLFTVQSQYVELMKGRRAFENGVSYLTHRTDGAKSKFQYDFSEVHASFDYAEKMAKIAGQVEARSKEHAEEEFNSLVAQYVAGQFSYSLLLEKLGADPMLSDQYGKHARALKEQHVLADIQEAKNFFKNFTQNQRVIWLYGETGSGKSYAASWMASHFAQKRFPDEEALNNAYQRLNSSRDPFSGYSSAVHCLVLDDMRPRKSVEPEDWLSIFDPHIQGERHFPARYHDKLQATSVIIVTSSMDPLEFWYRLFKVFTKNKLYIQNYGQYHNHKLFNHDQKSKADMPWVSCEDPGQLLRRVNPYLLERDEATGYVSFSKPVYQSYRDKYWEIKGYQPTDNSLQTVWECVPRNKYLGKEDQAMTERDKYLCDIFETRLLIMNHSDPVEAVVKRNLVPGYYIQFPANALIGPAKIKLKKQTKLT